MFNRRSLIARSVGTSIFAAIFAFALGCSTDAPSPAAPEGLEPTEQIQVLPYGCYGGPGQVYPVGTCLPGGFFEPGGTVSPLAVCSTSLVSFFAVPHFTVTTSANKGLFTAYCGGTTRKSVLAYTFTVQDYLALRATLPNPPNDSYAVTTSFVPNTSQLHLWVNPLINGTTSGRPGVPARLIGDDVTTGPYPITPVGTYHFVVAPNLVTPCGTARGWVNFTKTCMDAAITGLPASTVLFEISNRKC